VGSVPVDREEHRSEHHRVISVKLAADGGDQLFGGACGVLITPGCDGSASPGQICGLVLAVSHRLPSGADSQPTQ
jgi:hypothetical protein